MQKSLVLFALVAIALSGTSASADGWGHVKGKFVYSTSPPAPSAINVTKDKEYCGKFNLVDESLVVNASNKGIQNVVVMLYVRRGKKVNVHPDLAKPAKPAVIDNTHCRFEPHIITAMAGQEILIKNDDTIGHNTKIDTFSNPATNFTVPAKGELKQTFSKPESSPSPVSCSIHPWMKGYLVIKDHPYVSVTNEHGEFELKNLPAGKLTLQFWQERTGYVEKVTLDGKKTRLRRGRIEVDIKDGETVDLGTILVGSDELK